MGIAGRSEAKLAMAMMRTGGGQTKYDNIPA